MSFSRRLETSGPMKFVSNGILDLEGSGSYVKANELQLTTKLAIAQGGHGASTATQARSNLGLAIGSDVQAYSSKLNDISGLTPSTGHFIKWDGTNFVSGAGVNFDADETTLQEVDNVFSVKDAGITAAKLASNAVTTAKVNNLAITEAKLSDGCVSSDKLADASVSSSKLVDLSITTGKLANLAVTNSKLANNAVDSTKILDGSVNGDKLSSTISGNKTFSGSLLVQSNISLQESGQMGSSSMKLYEAQSTNNTQFNLVSVPISTDAVLFAEVFVSVCSSDMSDFASYKLHGVVKNSNGTSSVGALNDEIIYRSDNSLSCVFDVNSNNLRVRCTGNSSNLRWTARVVFVECPKYSS